ncbi:hypothetical protein JTB14_036629 [Gonioctena quinquepunctata]|nr:hypothetical protein JTB14_036629 [Gonioctena quinquepunctata]
MESPKKSGSYINKEQVLVLFGVWNLQYSVPWLVHNINVITEENSQKENDSTVNIYEAAVTFSLVEALLKVGVAASQIRVISTYRSQMLVVWTDFKEKIVSSFILAQNREILQFRELGQSSKYWKIKEDSQ